MIIKVPGEPCGLTDLYDAVAKQIGYDDTSELEYDCTKINVSLDVQDAFYEFYAAIAREANPDVTEQEASTATTVLLAVSGPKVDIHLNANEVEVFDGFIC